MVWSPSDLTEKCERCTDKHSYPVKLITWLIIESASVGLKGTVGGVQSQIATLKL